VDISDMVHSPTKSFVVPTHKVSK